MAKSNIPDLSSLKQINDVLSDMTTKLEKLSSSAIEKFSEVDSRPWGELEKSFGKFATTAAKFSPRWEKSLTKILEQEKQLKKERDTQTQWYKKTEKDLLKNINLQNKRKELEKGGLKLSAERSRKLQKENEDLSDSLLKQFSSIASLDQQLDDLPKKMTVGKLILSSMLDIALKIGSAIAQIGFSSLGAVFGGLESGIKKVYELYERWTKAIGQLNMQVGALSPNMDEFTKIAKKNEGIIRGLTDEFGRGLEMSAEWADGFERLRLAGDKNNRELEKFAKTGLEVGRGLGLGTEQAGAFQKSLYQLGESADEASVTFGRIMKGAKVAGISTNKWAKEIAAGRNFVVSFGKAAQKSFLQGAAWAKSMGIELKSLQHFTDLTDTFEGATQAAAKMNTVFGTSIDSLQLMMENDPAKRLEMVGKQLLSQGRDIEHLSRQEQKLLAQTTGLSEEELQGMLSALKAGKDLNKFQAEANKEKEDAAKTEKDLQKAMLKTAQTMFAFGAAWDRLTLKIAKLIKPFTDAIGLTVKGKEGFAGLGKTAGGVFDAIGGFLDRLSKNDSLNEFLSTLGKDLVSIFKRINEFTKGTDMNQLITDLSKGIGDFWKKLNEGVDYIIAHLPEITKGIGELASTLGTVAKGLELILWPLKKIFELKQAISDLTEIEIAQTKNDAYLQETIRKAEEKKAQRDRDKLLNEKYHGSAIEEMTGMSITDAVKPRRQYADELAPNRSQPNLVKKTTATAAGKPIIIHNHVHLDGKEIGNSIVNDAGSMPGVQ